MTRRARTGSFESQTTFFENYQSKVMPVHAAHFKIQNKSFYAHKQPKFHQTPKFRTTFMAQVTHKKKKQIRAIKQRNKERLSFQIIITALIAIIICLLIRLQNFASQQICSFLQIIFSQKHITTYLQMDTKYKILDQIGQGSFGSVYLVKDNKQRNFALKKIHVDPFQIEQALKEIQIMKKFVHPNLIKIYESQFDESNELLQISMEYCAEGDLFSYYKKKKTFSVEEILKIFKQVVQAFIVMNVKGVIHRDLKPQNILIGKGSVIKIADFGCARNVNKQLISQAGNFSLDKGTPIYASPQQLMNEKYSAKCDVWSAGCLLYFITFGQHPFMDKKVHNTLSLIKKKTQGKEIELDKKTDPKIAQILSLTLIYEDKQRASWRQLSLSRVFSQKIDNVQSFVEYLKHVSIIANWIAKEFWKNRKTVNMEKHKDEIFVYFIIKFQVTSMKMALQILNNDPKHLYLFNKQAYISFKPQPQLIQDIKRTFADHQKYYTAIKKSMKTKDVFKLISQRQPNRVSCFSDLDNSMRACYKILLQIRKQLKDGEDNKVWACMSKWINFERNFSYELEPRVEKILVAQGENIQKTVNVEIENYQQGIID